MKRENDHSQVKGTMIKESLFLSFLGFWRGQGTLIGTKFMAMFKMHLLALSSYKVIQRSHYHEKFSFIMNDRIELLANIKVVLGMFGEAT